MLKKLIVASVFSLGLFTIPATSISAFASPQIFENMSGSWRGKGLVKSGPKAKNESIRCKLRSKQDGTSKLKMSGNCAVSGFIFSLNGYIQQNGGKNAYSASMFRSLANLKQSNFSGKRSGSKINFSFKARDRISKQNIVAKINLNSRSAKTFIVDISRTDPKSGKVFKVGTINFAKR